MRARLYLIVLIVLIGLIVTIGACREQQQKQVAPPKTAIPDATVTAPPRRPAARAKLVAAPVAAGAVTLSPRLPPKRENMTNHLDVTGWTADSKAFGYCVVEDGSGCYKCKLITLEGSHQVENECGKEAEPNPRVLRALKARIKKRGFPAAATKWNFGADLELSHTRRASAGARFKGAKRGYHPLRFKRPNEGTVHLAALQISPDGKWLGAIGHTFHGEYTDTYPIELIEANKLAASTYNMAGLALHKKGQAAEAAKLFHKAAFADPEHAHATYNLACAWARTADRRAATALALAISKGGDAVKDKAKRDADFAAIRRQKWFSDLVGPATKDQRSQ